MMKRPASEWAMIAALVVCLVVSLYFGVVGL